MTLERSNLFKEEAEIQSLVSGLMAGQVKLEQLTRMEIESISRDVRINKCYENSGCSSVADFLALGPRRMKLRNYGKKSELILREDLVDFLRDMLEEATFAFGGDAFKNNQEADYNVNELKANPRLASELLDKKWFEIRTRLSEPEYSERLVGAVAAEIGLPWPTSRKSPISQLKVGEVVLKGWDYIKRTGAIGKKRSSIITVAVLHLYKMAEEVENNASLSITELVSTVWAQSGLTPKEKEVIELRFGISHRRHTLSEIASMRRVTRERIRQIEAKALGKLRHHRYFNLISPAIERNVENLWKTLSDEGVLIRRSLPIGALSSKLSFEEQLAIELVQDFDRREENRYALVKWLCDRFPFDETNWYRSNEAREQMSKRHAVLPRRIASLLASLS